MTSDVSGISSNINRDVNIDIAVTYVIMKSSQTTLDFVNINGHTS